MDFQVLTVHACNCDFGVPGNHSHSVILFDDYETFIHVWTTATQYSHPHLLRSFTSEPLAFGQIMSYLITYCQSTSLSRYVERDFYRNTSFFGQPVVGTLPHTNARTLIRQLLNVVRDFHNNNGVSFHGLSVNNLVMVDRTLNLIRVRAYLITDDGKRADLQSVARIIEGLYRQHDMPVEFEALVQLLDSGWQHNGIDYSDLIYDHPSTWEASRRIAFMRQVGDWRDFTSFEQRDALDVALNNLNLNLTWLPNWHNRVPGGSPLYKCLEYMLYDNTAIALARFIRNCCGHVSHHSIEGTVFSQWDIDDIMTYFFPMYLVQLQTLLFPHFGTKFFAS